MAAKSHMVAIVEDDPSVRRALRRFASSLGHDAHVFASGNEFLCSGEGLSPALVIVDLHMPGLSGAQLVTRFRARLPNAWIVVISGLETPGAAQACLAAGADRFLRKPIGQVDMEGLFARP